MGSGNGTTSKKISAAQRAERIKAAKEREEQAIAKREAAQKRKKIFTVIVCVILILALCIPTMALTVLSAGA